jgi:hypothetical protein
MPTPGYSRSHAARVAALRQARAWPAVNANPMRCNAVRDTEVRRACPTARPSTCSANVPTAQPWSSQKNRRTRHRSTTGRPATGASSGFRSLRLRTRPDHHTGKVRQQSVPTSRDHTPTMIAGTGHAASTSPQVDTAISDRTARLQPRPTGWPRRAVLHVPSL